MPLIENFGLSRRFEEMVAGDDLNLTVETGEVLGLLGHNKEPKGDPLRPTGIQSGEPLVGFAFPCRRQVPPVLVHSGSKSGRPD